MFGVLGVEGRTAGVEWDGGGELCEGGGELCEGGGELCAGAGGLLLFFLSSPGKAVASARDRAIAIPVVRNGSVIL